MTCGGDDAAGSTRHGIRIGSVVAYVRWSFSSDALRDIEVVGRDSVNVAGMLTHKAVQTALHGAALIGKAVIGIDMVHPAGMDRPEPVVGRSAARNGRSPVQVYAKNFSGLRDFWLIP